MVVAAGCLLSTQAARAAEPDESARAQTLAPYLRPSPVLAAVEPYWGAVLGTSCAAGTVAATVDEMRDAHGAKPYVIGMLGACTAVSVASYALPSDYQNRVVAATFLGTAGALVIPLVHFSDYVTPANRVTSFAYGGAYMAFGGMLLLDAALSRPVSLRTLSADADRLDAWGASLGQRELGRMERHLQRFHEGPLPRWSYGAMLLTAAVVAASPGFVDSTSRSDRKFAYIGGGLLALQGGLALTTALTAPRQYDEYRHALGKVNLAPVGPEGSLGLSLSGSF
jgi:hypothetical protein